jgi:hypothetical protein
MMVVDVVGQRKRTFFIFSASRLPSVIFLFP